MKSKTLKQFLAEKRKAYAQSAEAVMKTLDTLYAVVYDEANDDPIGLLDEMYDAAGKGEDTCLIVGGDTEDEFPTYHLRNLRTGQMVEREPRAPYQFRDWMLKLTR